MKKRMEKKLILGKLKIAKLSQESQAALQRRRRQTHLHRLQLLQMSASPGRTTVNGSLCIE